MQSLDLACFSEGSYSTCECRSTDAMTNWGASAKTCTLECSDVHLAYVVGWSELPVDDSGVCVFT